MSHSSSFYSAQTSHSLDPHQPWFPRRMLQRSGSSWGTSESPKPESLNSLNPKRHVLRCRWRQSLPTADESVPWSDKGVGAPHPPQSLGFKGLLSRPKDFPGHRHCLRSSAICETIALEYDLDLSKATSSIEPRFQAPRSAWKSRGYSRGLSSYLHYFGGPLLVFFYNIPPPPPNPNLLMKVPI